MVSLAGGGGGARHRLLTLRNFVFALALAAVFVLWRSTSLQSRLADATRASRNKMNWIPIKVKAMMNGDSHPDAEFPQRAECDALKAKYGIVVGSSWGNATAEAQTQWAKVFCDDVYDDGTAPHHEAHVPFGGRAQSTLVLDHNIDMSKKPKDTTLIAFLTPMTTAHSITNITHEHQMVFWKLLFPSFLNASSEVLKAPEEKFWYVFYIGYDAGDAVFEKPAERAAIAVHMLREAQERNLPLHRIGVRIYRLGDTVHAPSWAVSHLAQMAYDDGADYFYQINDDVELESHGWEHALTATLAAHRDFGVTGPTDVSNPWILTQAFVHRTHLDIFDGLFFAEPFRNWWSDDWLTQVYTDAHTLRGAAHMAGGRAVTVRHAHKTEGRRYPVHLVKNQLGREVRSGRKKIRAWLKQRGLADTFALPA